MGGSGLVNVAEISTKLKALEKYYRELEQISKRYTSIIDNANTMHDDVEGAVLQYNEQVYEKAYKSLSSIAALSKAVDSPLDVISDKVGEALKLPAKRRRGSAQVEEPLPGASKTRRGKKSTPPPVAETLMGYERSSGFIVSVNSLVSAREPDSDQWILAKVLAYSQGRYEVEDYAPADEEDQTLKRFTCSLEDVLALPPDPNTVNSTVMPSPVPGGSSNPITLLYNPIPQRSSCLAVFPHTTAFYPAKVASITKKNKIALSYQLHFDDDREDGYTPSRKVTAQYVIPLAK